MLPASGSASAVGMQESMIIDIGPALLKAKEAVSERAEPGGDTSKLIERARGPLTTSHAAVRHLDVCESRHCWRWVPDQRLSQLWRELSAEDRARVVETHSGGQAVRRFCKEMTSHIKPKECRASDKAKKSLGAVFMLDQHSLSIYKEIFVVAVEVPSVLSVPPAESLFRVDSCSSPTRDSPSSELSSLSTAELASVSSPSLVSPSSLASS